MAELPPGYKDISEEDQRKAQVFFDRARTVSDTGNYEYAIEMYLQGLAIDPDSVPAHAAMREIALRRKATGGKPLGFMDRQKLKKGDDRQNMLNGEKLLAYDPGNMDHMVSVLVGAQKAGCYDTVMWIGNILQRANLEQKKQDLHKFLTLKEVYKAIGRFEQAVDACVHAIRLKPNDMDLQQEMKNLSAEMTMMKGNYNAGGSFRDSVRDMAAQKKLLDRDSDIRTADSMTRAVMEAEEEFQAHPGDPAVFNRLIEALRKTEQPDFENRAIELLEGKYRETRQYRYRQAVNGITITQMGRMERSLRDAVNKSPDDAELKKDYQQFARERAERELEIFKETVENYPTDSTARFEMGRRMFALGRYDEAIPVFQQTRSDPKYRAASSMLLGRAFLHSGYVDEAVETLQGVIADYPTKGDERSIEMHYYCGLAQKQKEDIPAALKMYSQVAQWNFNYRDVQQRIKRLRGAQGPNTAKPS